MRVISPFCGSIELALIHTDGTGKGLEVGFATKGLAGLDGLDRTKQVSLIILSPKPLSRNNDWGTIWSICQP